MSAELKKETKLSMVRAPNTDKGKHRTLYQSGATTTLGTLETIKSAHNYSPKEKRNERTLSPLKKNFMKDFLEDKNAIKCISQNLKLLHDDIIG